ncbi:hypothetical protein V6N12_061982 [Hibiscus sabdariffa]|uniref:Secreted protein n=1 Tax=Hibiscus sabdariffa TaxID=183260 RepID=A0ABR2DZ76_9ROSI
MMAKAIMTSSILGLTSLFKLKPSDCKVCGGDIRPTSLQTLLSTPSIFTAPPLTPTSLFAAIAPNPVETTRSGSSLTPP